MNTMDPSNSEPYDFANVLIESINAWVQYKNQNISNEHTELAKQVFESLSAWYCSKGGNVTPGDIEAAILKLVWPSSSKHSSKTTSKVTLPVQNGMFPFQQCKRHIKGNNPRQCENPADETGYCKKCQNLATVKKELQKYSTTSGTYNLGAFPKNDYNGNGGGLPNPSLGNTGGIGIRTRVGGPVPSVNPIVPGGGYNIVPPARVGPPGTASVPLPNLQRSTLVPPKLNLVPCPTDPNAQMEMTHGFKVVNGNEVVSVLEEEAERDLTPNEVTIARNLGLKVPGAPESSGVVPKINVPGHSVPTPLVSYPGKSTHPPSTIHAPGVTPGMNNVPGLPKVLPVKTTVPSVSIPGNANATNATNATNAPNVGNKTISMPPKVTQMPQVPHITRPSINSISSPSNITNGPGSPSTGSGGQNVLPAKSLPKPFLPNASGVKQPIPGEQGETANANANSNANLDSNVLDNVIEEVEDNNDLRAEEVADGNMHH